MNKPFSPKKSNPTDWHPADIVAALHKRGLSLRSVAKSHGVSHDAVISALRKSRPTSERRIAAALGIAPHIIWPSRHHPDGSRIQAKRGRKNPRGPEIVANSRASVNGRAGEGA